MTGAVTTPVEAATAYFAAWKAKDFAALRALLADDVSFRGPLGRADHAEDAMPGLQAMAGMTTDLVVERMLSEGPDVMTWFALHTSVADEPLPVVNWSRVEGERITRIRVTFDPRPLIGD